MEALPGVCLCGGGAPPPLSILALEQVLAQKSCFPKIWHQFQLIWPLFRIFLQKSQTKCRKLKNCQKMLKLSENSQFCNS